jgi:glycosyltransferase involved in cell wall biosynthesis
MSAEELAASERLGGGLNDAWRAARARAQERELPPGRVLVSCPAPYGGGGLGRHLLETVEALGRRGATPRFICDPPAALPGAVAPPAGRPVSAERVIAPLLRFSPAWRLWAGSRAFDTRAAGALSDADHLIAFNGTAKAQFARAHGAGWESVALMSANSHFERVLAQHERAYGRYPIERPWPTHLLRRNLAEYRAADRIYVSSTYVRESFLERGFAPERLASFPLTPDPRYAPDRGAPRPSTFEIVYVGSLVVHKGVPLLIEAFRRVAGSDLRLVLVGGWKTRGMRHFIESTCAADPRISVAPGDPLPHLRRARLCVHPAYEDGFAYAPAEALASGVPVIVSEDTGMKELIDGQRSGLVLPTGDLDALTGAIESASRGEILDGAG